eukprot:CAMPEP_0202686954 /NCGR_PEP_ID=MMETSP1385-20130828/2692_1 /ASSEMBLY_ACC=CAM_ASM_000861 /TAXON_ID=933848 /ORGANISM="Elphidium margaritaceum" /LENGTH=1118 /DNA_ID=CAMNT_0049341643 /DNA_START=39 /DNA_END=3395 /DNA_ORIENTATION=+
MSVEPNRAHHKKQQSWWKKNPNKRSNPKKTRTFIHANANGTHGNGNATIDDHKDNETRHNLNGSMTDSNPEVVSNQATSASASLNGSNMTAASDVDIMSADPQSLTSRQIRFLQSDYARILKMNHHLEMELTLRANQVEQMEDNLRLVADQSKMIGVRAMEQEQKLGEMKKALELKSKQLALYRRSKADQIPLNAITVLPMHLRGKFSEFLRGVLLSQKKFFVSALRDFVEKQISDQELKVVPIQVAGQPQQPLLTRIALMSEIGKIGNSLALDYMSELELRLNGTFSANADTAYSLNDGQQQQPQQQQQQLQGHKPSTSSEMNLTPQMSPNPPNINTNNTASSPYAHTPQGSFGSVGMPAMMSTPQTSADRSSKMFDKAKKLLSTATKSATKRKKSQPEPPQTIMTQDLSAASATSTSNQQMQTQMQMVQQQMPQQYPPPYQHQQSTHHQYPAMQPHQYPVSTERAKQAYSFHPSRTSEHQSNSAVAALMTEIGDVDDSDSGSMVVKNEDDDELGTDQEFDDDVAPSNKSKQQSVQSADSENATTNGHVLSPTPEDNFAVSMNVNPMAMSIMQSRGDDGGGGGAGGRSIDDDDETGDEDDDHFDGDAAEMQKHLAQLTNQATQAILSKHGPDGSSELNRMWSQFVQFKKEMDRPSDAPLAYTVPDKTSPFVELRDMLDALPYALSLAILQEQQMNPYDRIKDVVIQRGCWPSVRFVKNNRVTIIHKVSVQFDDVLRRLEMYLKHDRDASHPQVLSAEHLAMMSGMDGGLGGGGGTKSTSTKKNTAPLKAAGLQLLGQLDPQKTTGFRLHQLTAVIRQRNEARDTITALNLRVGRLWNMDVSMQQNLISDTLDFFQSLDSPATMLLLGPNSSEKSALCREITRQLSSAPINLRTALVDTRSTVGGFTKSPIQTGQAVRFYVNTVEKQSHMIDSTRSIYPQVVVVDEVVTQDDIASIGRLQSEGISAVLGTNMHSLEALVGHPLYSQLLPPQDRLVSPSDYPLNSMMGGAGHSRRASYQYSSMSPYLLILEMNFDGTQVKVYKDIPAAVKAIKRYGQPEFSEYKLRWQGYNPSDASTATKYINNPVHKRTTSRMVNRMMKDSLSTRNLSIPSTGSATQL